MIMLHFSDKKEIKHDELQEQMANELLSLTRSLKENMKISGNVIKDDNQVFLDI